MIEARRKVEDGMPKILVIDDTHANLVAMRALLKSAPAETITAQSGNAGLAKALDDNIALILLDVNMPEMDGFQVAELLGEMDETCNIPIIFLTALHSSEQNRLRGYGSGAIDYIEKPINTDILLSKVQLFIKMWTLRFEMKQEIKLRIEAEKKIEYLAQRDALTQLPNRRQLHVEMQQIISRATRSRTSFAALFLDLDGFKKINDEMGHEAGDYVLKEMARRFTQIVRNSDVVARYGGDEFILLLPDLHDSLALTNKLKELTSSANKSLEWQGSQLRVGVSIGVSIFPEHGKDSDTLLNNADTAMYQAKGDGRNTFRFFSDELHDRLKRRLLLESHLVAAFENEEFELNLQPIVDAKTGKMVAAEALLRWHNKELGTVSPEEFIPIAESSPLIHELGIWVLHKTVKLMQQYTDVHFAINASPLQFNNSVFCDELEKIITQGCLNPRKLEIEITEGLLLANTPEIKEQLGKVRSLGIGLSVDDFGTGYSALGYLKQHPVTKLKIDRSFISEIPSNQESAALVKAILAMGHALNLQVVAEGVETAEQWSFLKHSTCDYAQGYYFSKPLNEEDFCTYLEKLCITDEVF